ncbi:uncharacterized protein B0I36DRAFT_331872 [Microdochium trichocladiopsis]|uniref:4Fe-4S ferredoxin-type domain-containing protein n=1 Tax=Microdochium trichocladiopsis TaxID=1682393 RepID=A0A9P8XXL3_9PEZI|nr:uncharacterized protein B0I36DRAFT_331872 [Microdochium trichocladiopsis]KAH7024693.1 hypothetical protein B0I36DRAFT_331872 [Microdochium trichocladiopsis]
MEGAAAAFGLGVNVLTVLDYGGRATSYVKRAANGQELTELLYRAQARAELLQSRMRGILEARPWARETFLMAQEVEVVLKQLLGLVDRIHDARHSSGFGRLKAAFETMQCQAELIMVYDRLERLQSQAIQQSCLLESQKSHALLEDSAELTRLMREERRLEQTFRNKADCRPYELLGDVVYEDHVRVDLGMGDVIRVRDTYILQSRETTVGWLSWKFCEQKRPGYRQLQHGEFELLDDAMDIINDSAWTFRVRPGMRVNMAFVMGTWHGISATKCLRCRKRYHPRMAGREWKHCLSCGLCRKVVPPDAYPYEPEDVSVSISPNVLRDHRTTKQGRATTGFEQEGNAGTDNNTKASPSVRVAADEDGPSLDVICRLMILKWEPISPITHRYLLCRCVLRLNTPSRLHGNFEMTIPTAAICPRHNTGGVRCKDYGDLVNNHEDPYFHKFGGYDVFRDQVARWGLDALGGDAFITPQERARARLRVTSMTPEELKQCNSAFEEYHYDLSCHFVASGESKAVPQRFASRYREEKLSREQDESLRPTWSEVWGKSAMKKELDQLVGGVWDGVPHWTPRI